LTLQVTRGISLNGMDWVFTVLRRRAEIDKMSRIEVYMCVFRFRRIVALVLLALWLPATQYCTLVAAEVFADDSQACAPEQCCTTEDQCSFDACNLFESGVTKLAREGSKALAPDFSACLCFICLRSSHSDSGDESALMKPALERPLDWESSWHFMRRAAPLARAPSAVG
jgi:hypothetical protein